MTAPPRRAIIFDFNGVLADDETPHFLAFQQALAEDGLGLSHEEYYGTYLGMDERNCTLALLAQDGGRADDGRLRRILERKAALFREHMADHKPPLFPGVTDFVKLAARHYRLAIASGGRREQIVWALQGTPIEQDFAVIVSAEDTRVGKPDPEIYRLALRGINDSGQAPSHPVRPEDVLVIEDSMAGIRAAHGAGMKVLALATTYQIDQLTEADCVLTGWGEVSCERLERLFGWGWDDRPGSDRRLF